MDKAKLAIATISWARDAAEETLLKTAFQTLSQIGVPVFVTDAGSGAAYMAFLKTLPNITLVPQHEKGLWAQTKSSLDAAYQSGAEFIFYTEGDKSDFFKQHLPRMVSGVETSAHTGVVVAARSKAAFASFPTLQQVTETTINRCHAEVIGPALDYVYGPFILNRNLVPYLETVPPTIGWGWRPYAFVLAHRLGWEVTAFSGDFWCPPDQQQETATDKLYRMKQLAQNMDGLNAGATARL